MFALLLTLTESRTRGPRHSQDARVKLWHVARDADTCGQYSVLQDASVTKPSSLCDTSEVGWDTIVGNWNKVRNFRQKEQIDSVFV